MIGLLLVFDQIFTGDDTQILFVWTDSDGNDLVALSCLTWEGSDLKLSVFDFLEVADIVHLDLVLASLRIKVCDQEDIHRHDI